MINKTLLTYPLTDSMKQQPDWNHVKVPLAVWVLKRKAQHVWAHSKPICVPFWNVSRHQSHTAPTPSDPFMEQQQRDPQELQCSSLGRILMLHPTHTHELRHTLNRLTNECSWAKKVCSQRVWLIVYTSPPNTEQTGRLTHPADVQDELGFNMIWGLHQTAVCYLCR